MGGCVGCTFGLDFLHYHHHYYYHHYHHHRLANMDFGHFSKSSDLACLMIYRGLLLVYGRFIISGNPLCGILFAFCYRFLVYSCIFSTLELYLVFICIPCVCFAFYPRVLRCFSQTFHQFLPLF